MYRCHLNYGGVVKRLNVINERLAELDYETAPSFMVNGLKREQLIAGKLYDPARALYFGSRR
jgi:hypothetical protein